MDNGRNKSIEVGAEAKVKVKATLRLRLRCNCTACAARAARGTCVEPVETSNALSAPKCCTPYFIHLM
jgi:hypothetical protein